MNPLVEFVESGPGGQRSPSGYRVRKCRSICHGFLSTFRIVKLTAVSQADRKLAKRSQGAYGCHGARFVASGVPETVRAVYRLCEFYEAYRSRLSFHSISWRSSEELDLRFLLGDLDLLSIITSSTVPSTTSGLPL